MPQSQTCSSSSERNVRSRCRTRSRLSSELVTTGISVSNAMFQRKSCYLLSLCQSPCVGACTSCGPLSLRKVGPSSSTQLSSSETGTVSYRSISNCLHHPLRLWESLLPLNPLGIPCSHTRSCCDVGLLPSCFPVAESEDSSQDSHLMRLRNHLHCFSKPTVTKSSPCTNTTTPSPPPRLKRHGHALPC